MGREIALGVEGGPRLRPIAKVELELVAIPPGRSERAAGRYRVAVFSNATRKDIGEIANVVAPLDGIDELPAPKVEAFFAISTLAQSAVLPLLARSKVSSSS